MLFQRQLLLLATGLLFPFAVSSQGPSQGSPAGYYDIRNYGARGDGAFDDTPAIQRAIEAASVKGGIVFVPPGQWLCRGHLELKKGVHLAGINQAPQSWEPAKGSILMPTEGRDNENGPAFIEMRSSASVRGVTIYYPEQTVDDIRPYPWTIRIRGNPNNPKDLAFDDTVENVTLINSYNGICTGPTENGRHRILSVYGCVLRRGIYIDWTGDIGRIENVQFHSHFWANQAFKGNWDKVFAYMQHNLEAFIFGRTDWEYVTNTFVFPASVGYRFIQTSNGAANGQLSGIGADATQIAFLVESIQPQGLLITNGEFNSHREGRSTQVVIEKTCRGNVRFVNCGFWGPVEQNAVVRGEGYTSFSDCYFSNNYDSPQYSLELNGGKVQVQNCTFDALSKGREPGHASGQPKRRYQPTCIHIGPGTANAIIRGNNGYYGVSIKNDLGSRAIVVNNEPFVPTNK